MHLGIWLRNPVEVGEWFLAWVEEVGRSVCGGMFLGGFLGEEWFLRILRMFDGDFLRIFRIF